MSACKDAASSVNRLTGLLKQAVAVFSPPRRSKNANGVANLTMKEAVEYLSKRDETFQHWGASYIQHNTYVNDKAKEEVGHFPTSGYRVSPRCPVGGVRKRKDGDVADWSLIQVRGKGGSI